MTIEIYEINGVYAFEGHRPPGWRHYVTHVLHVPDDATIAIKHGKPVLVLPPISQHSPTITFAAHMVMHAAAKRSIIGLYRQTIIV